MSTEMLVHARARLALHVLREEGHGHPLLLLHGLGERTPAQVPPAVASWPGPVLGLDFTGHGASTLPVGGGYTAEVLMADVDTALRHLTGAGSARDADGAVGTGGVDGGAVAARGRGATTGAARVTLLGRGLGAYVALLAAGARADLLHGAVLADGPGLVGGGIRPGSPFVVTLDDASLAGPPDPYALVELSRDVRPPDYAMTYVRHAVEYGVLEAPLAVTTVVRPEWIEGIVGEPGVIECSVAEALALYAS